MSKKKKKMRGKRTHGYGSKKKHRGKGSKGGRGYAGSKKHHSIGLKKYEPGHFEKKKLKTKEEKGMREPVETINVKDLDMNFDEKEIDLREMGIDKLLGGGQINREVKVKVDDYSEKAKQKIEDVGGQIISE